MSTDQNPGRCFFDTEFIEDGRTIDLLSIGIVRADGDFYYAEPAEADRSRANDWVRENVLPHLTGPMKPREQIAREIVQFVGPHPEFWAYFADYDWVVLCQLYGRMIDLPEGWPMFCMDLKQLAASYGNPDLHELVSQDGVEHHALADAQWVADVWHRLTGTEQNKHRARPRKDLGSLAASCAACGHAVEFDDNHWVHVAQQFRTSNV